MPSGARVAIAVHPAEPEAFGLIYDRYAATLSSRLNRPGRACANQSSRTGKGGI